MSLDTPAVPEAENLAPGPTPGTEPHNAKTKAGSKKRKRATTKPEHKISTVGTKVLMELLMHGWMDTPMLIERMAPHVGPDRVRQVLRELKTAGLASATTPTQLRAGVKNPPLVYRATPSAKRALENSHELRAVRIADPPTNIEMKVRLLDHNLSVNRLGIILEKATKDAGYQPTWVNEVMHYVSERGSEKERKLFSDMYFTADKTDDQGRIETLRILCELDRGTEAPSVLAGKQRQYQALYTYVRKNDDKPVWQHYYPYAPGIAQDGMPQVMWVFDCEDADKRADTFVNAVSAPMYAPDLAESKLWTTVTTKERLDTYGPMDTRTFFDVYMGRNGNITGDFHEGPDGPCIWPPLAAERHGARLEDDTILHSHVPPPFAPSAE